MSWTASSSECEYDEYCQNNYYDASYWDVNEGAHYGPFYPTMGQPLVYYAQVPRSVSRRNKERSRGVKKRNPNFFVKAFRWCTQEHYPSHQTTISNKRDVGEFATWLDSKYSEYLRDVELDENVCRVKLQQTSTIEADNIPYNMACDQCCNSNRITKPSTRKRRRRFSKDYGCSHEKSNHSFEYILHPKDLTRPVSDCNHNYPPESINHSTATVMSSDTHISKKTVTKSRSLSSINRDRNETPIRVITVHEIPNVGRIVEENYDSKTSQIAHDQRRIATLTPSVHVHERNEIEKRRSKVSRKVSGSCQCDGFTVTKTDAHTQYEIVESSSNNHYQTFNVPNKPQHHKAATQQSFYEKATNHKFDTEYYERMESKHTLLSDISCQCSIYNMFKEDAHCQYIYPESNSESNSCDIYYERDNKNEVPKMDLLHGNPARVVHEHMPHIKETDSFIVTNLTNLTKITRQCTVFVNDATQTCDHPIIFDNTYPLFMKIICPDKLKE